MATQLAVRIAALIPCRLEIDGCDGHGTFSFEASDQLVKALVRVTVSTPAVERVL
ncbi:MAG: hypothetical protein ACYC5V_01980 [Gemmatimonadaceae bacterium]